MEEKEVVSKNFIEQIIDKDLEEGHTHTVATRFPPAYRTCEIYFTELWIGP